jgi:Fe-S-cluster-containing dehydrogenase component
VVNRFDNPNDSDKPYYVKKQCMHCNEPACASACLVAAFTKTKEGPVIYNPNVCIGCRYCMVACPYYIPTYDYFEPLSPEVRKCTMCYDRIQEGKIPACAEICPKEAITFGKRSDLITLAREKIRHDPERYHPYLFGENEAGGTGWLYLAGTDFGKLGFPTDIGTTPYPELTRGFLSVVPLVLTIWPVLLTGFYKFSKARENYATEIETEAGERKQSDVYRTE